MYDARLPWPSLEATGRFFALTMPVVTVPDRPKGAPIAMVASPTATLLESASGSGSSLRFPTPLSLSTAMSYPWALPTTCASYFLPSEKVAVSLPPCAALATTWLLVRMWPSLSKTKPVPVPSSPPPEERIVTTLGSALAAIPATDLGERLSFPGSPEELIVVLPPLALRSATQ